MDSNPLEKHVRSDDEVGMASIRELVGMWLGELNRGAPEPERRNEMLQFLQTKIERVKEMKGGDKDFEWERNGTLELMAELQEKLDSNI